MKALSPEHSLNNLVPKFIHFSDSILLGYCGKIISIIRINQIYQTNFIPDIEEAGDRIQETLSKIYDEDIGFYLKNVKSEIDIYSPLLHHTRYNYLNPITKFISDAYYQKIGQLNYEHQVYLIVTCKTNNIYDNFSLNQNKLYEHKCARLRKSIDKLSTTCNIILESLNKYHPYLLKRRDSNSELIDFYYSLLDMPTISFKEFDVQGYLSGGTYSSCENILKITHNTEIRYIGFISIKEMNNIDKGSLARLMSQDIKFDMTEIIIPSQDTKLKNRIYDIQKTATGTIKDHFTRHFEVQNFYKSSIILTIISSEISQIKQHLEHLSKVLSELGISHVRDAILNEYNLYWHFPLNLYNLKYQQFIKPQVNIGDSLCLNSIRGEASSQDISYICIFKEKNQTNFYFNHLGPKVTNTITQNSSILRFIASSTTRSIEDEIRLSNFYICTTSINVVFCNIIGFKKLDLINPFLYLNENNFNFFETFLSNLISFGDLMLNFDKTVYDVAINNLNYITGADQAYQNIVHDEKKSQTQPNLKTSIVQFLEYILLFKNRTIMKNSQFPNLESIYKIYIKLDTHDVRIADILKFIYEKYNFTNEGFEDAEQKSVYDFYLDARDLTQISFKQKFYPKGDERKVVQFNLHQEFHNLFAKNYLKLYVELIKNIFYNSKTTAFLENIETIMHQADICDLIKLFNQHNINTILLSNESLPMQFDHTFETSKLDSDCIMYRSLKRTLELELRPIAHLNDVLNFEIEDAAEIAEKKLSGYEAIKYLMRSNKQII